MFRKLVIVLFVLLNFVFAQSSSESGEFFTNVYSTKQFNNALRFTFGDGISKESLWKKN